MTRRLVHSSDCRDDGDKSSRQPRPALDDSRPGAANEKHSGADRADTRSLSGRCTRTEQEDAHEEHEDGRFEAFCEFHAVFFALTCATYG